MATSIRGSLRNLISEAAQREIIDKKTEEELVYLITDTGHHQQMRSELMMIIMPRHVNEPGEGQTAYVHPVFRRLCYPTALHPEGIFVLKSVTDVISKIKAKISPRLETFYHPEIDDSHRDFLNFPRNRKTLTDALESGRHVTCCVKNEAQGDDVNHCVVLIENRDGKYIFKNSMKTKPLISKSIKALECFNLSYGGQIRLPDPVEGFCLYFELCE